MNILILLLHVGRENRNHFAGFIQDSAVFEWSSETSKAHQAIIFALKPQNLTTIVEIFSTFSFYLPCYSVSSWDTCVQNRICLDVSWHHHYHYLDLNRSHSLNIYALSCFWCAFLHLISTITLWNRFYYTKPRIRISNYHSIAHITGKGQSQKLSDDKNLF